ncbi:unnamed protein product, partial [Prorocentrum cordatum]
YRHPHALLAAGALAAALRVAEAPASHLEDLLSDVAAYGLLDDQELSGGVAGVVLECEEELLQTWMRCAFEAHELSSFFRVLQAKYSRWGYGRVGLLSPAAALARLQEDRAAVADVRLRRGGEGRLLAETPAIQLLHETATGGDGRPRRGSLEAQPDHSEGE